MELNPNWEICGEASDGLEAVHKTAELKPDMVIMDVQMPRLNGLEATRKIHAAAPGICVLIVTFYESSDLPQMVRDAGARGFVLKSELFEALTDAIETVMGSDRFFACPHSS